MKVLKKILYPVFLLIMLSACSGTSQRTTASKSEGTLYPVHCAELFAISQTDSYTIVTVFSPWSVGEVYATYYLVKDEQADVPAGGSKVVVPLQNIMTNSATHLGFLDLLELEDKVIGVCSADFVYNEAIREGVKAGRIQDLGDAFNLDIERLLMLRPQAVMTTAYNADDENSKKMKQTGLTLLYNIEWQEKTLLGRAEWIKFVAAFFDKLDVAEEVFCAVKDKYESLISLVGEPAITPVVLSGQDFRGSWSMPGGQSFNAQLFRDAGGDYYYQNDKSSGSIQTTIEEALIHFGKADVWVGAQSNTLEELAQTDRKYTLFKAYKEGRVYNNNNRVTATGGNDYWEGAVVRPDLLLKDMVMILHPHLFPEEELTYMKKLQ